MFKDVGTVNRTCSCQERRVGCCAFSLVGGGGRAGSSVSSTHPAVRLSQLLGRRGSPECGHSESSPKCEQQRAQHFPCHLSHCLGLLCVCRNSPVRWRCSGAWYCLLGHILGFQLCWGMLVLELTAGLWGHGCHLPRGRAGRAACQAGIQVLGEAGGFSRAPQRRLRLPARPAVRLCSHREGSQLLEVTI